MDRVIIIRSPVTLVPECSCSPITRSPLSCSLIDRSATLTSQLLAPQLLAPQLLAYTLDHHFRVVIYISMKLLIQGGVGGGGGEGRGKEDEEEYRRRCAKMLRDGLCTILYHNDDNKYGRSVIVRGGGI